MYGCSLFTEDSIFQGGTNLFSTQPRREPCAPGITIQRNSTLELSTRRSWFSSVGSRSKSNMLSVFPQELWQVSHGATAFRSFSSTQGMCTTWPSMSMRANSRGLFSAVISWASTTALALTTLGQRHGHGTTTYPSTWQRSKTPAMFSGQQHCRPCGTVGCSVWIVWTERWAARSKVFCCNITLCSKGRTLSPGSATTASRQPTGCAAQTPSLPGQTLWMSRSTWKRSNEINKWRADPTSGNDDAEMPGGAGDEVAHTKWTIMMLMPRSISTLEERNSERDLRQKPTQLVNNFEFS